MSRGASTFRQRDLTAAVRAMTAAGQTLSRVEVDKDGRIILMVAGAKAAPDDSETPDELRGLI